MTSPISNASVPMRTITDLPNELLAHIGDHCDNASLHNLRLVSKTCYQGTWHDYTQRYMPKVTVQSGIDQVSRVLPIISLPGAGSTTKKLNFMSSVWTMLHGDGNDAEDEDDDEEEFVVHEHYSHDSASLDQITALVAAIPNVESIKFDHDESPDIYWGADEAYTSPLLAHVLIASPRPALRKLKLRQMELREEDILALLRAHKDTLRELQLKEIKLSSGSLLNVLLCIRDDLQLTLLTIEWIYSNGDLAGPYELMGTAPEEFHREMFAPPWSQRQRKRATNGLDIDAQEGWMVSREKVLEGLDHIIKYHWVSPLGALEDEDEQNEDEQKEDEQDGDEQDGDEQNGDEQDGDEQDGDELDADELGLDE